MSVADYADLPGRAGQTAGIFIGALQLTEGYMEIVGSWKKLGWLTWSADALRRKRARRVCDVIRRPGKLGRSMLRPYTESFQRLFCAWQFEDLLLEEVFEGLAGV
jgi:hypothetical protein